MPTLLQYRQAAAKLIGPFYTGTATAASTPSALVIAAWPFQSSISQDDVFTGHYLYRPSAVLASDKTRVVPDGGYAPSSGTITPDLAWTNAPYVGGVGESVELHGVIPPGDVMPDLVSESLKHCLLVCEFTLAPVALQQRHNLSTGQSWLTEPKWVRQVGWLASGESREQVDPYVRPVPGFCEKIGDAVYLNHKGWAFNAGDTIYVKALKLAYDQCRPTGGTFGSQSGLTLDTDEAVPDVEWVAVGTVVAALDRFRHLLDQRGNALIARDTQEFAVRFTALASKNLTIPELTLRESVAWGPPRGGGWR